jgi:hypothetical protein
MRFFSPILGDANPKDKTWIATNICLSSNDAKNDLGSIISNIPRFLRISFLLRKELDFKILLASEEGGILNGLTNPVSSSLYN